MRRHHLFLAFLLAACDGGGQEVPDAAAPDAPAGDLLIRLEALPGVTSVTELPSTNVGYRAFDLRITQEVVHGDATAGTFSQQMTLLSVDETAPMILVSTGYWDYYGQNLSELAQLLHANQLVVEHRYFGDSIPANPDWTQLTIENAAGDHHVIVQAMKTIYGAAWIATGASKGGMTSIYHRRFWPDDVDGTVPYVAPISFDAPDNRYDTYYQALGTPTCRQALQDLEHELLANRRAMLETRAQLQATQQGITYTRVPIGPAVESAVASIYWGFWQYYGVDFCQYVPPVTATDDDVWSFLDYFSPVASSDDDQADAFQAYYYQAYFQLGYPGTIDTWLAGLTMYDASAYDGLLPAGAAPPTYDGGAAMNDVDQWMQSAASRMIFVYGQWDPWSGGAFTLGGAADAEKDVVPMGTHGSDLSSLPLAERDTAFEKLARWTGVTPSFSFQARTRVPRIPAAALQAWRLRAASR